MDSPRPNDIIECRTKCGFTQTQAAELIELKLRTWQRYESGERELPGLMWAVWRIRARLDKPESILPRKRATK